MFKRHQSSRTEKEPGLCRRRDNTILCGKENQLPCGDYTADQKATVYDSYQHTQSILRVHVDLGSREV